MKYIERIIQTFITLYLVIVFVLVGVGRKEDPLDNDGHTDGHTKEGSDIIVKNSTDDYHYNYNGEEKYLIRSTQILIFTNFNFST